MTCSARSDASRAFLHVGFDVRVYAVDQRVLQPFAHGQGSPLLIRSPLPASGFHRIGEGEKPIGRARPPVQNHVLHRLAQRGFDFVVDPKLTCVHDAHVHPALVAWYRKTE